MGYQQYSAAGAGFDFDGYHVHPFAEWTTDELAVPDLANAAVDGADVTTDNTKSGARVGNHTQQIGEARDCVRAGECE